jgi:type IV secretory pathway VirJ component
MVIRWCVATLLACSLLLSFNVTAETPVDDLKLDLLPVTQMNPADKDKPMVVFFSGDGGWAELDTTVSENLVKQGMPVVGWSSLTYYWSFKSPDQTTKDLQRILAYYTKLWQRNRVIFIGYSFGAETFPFVVNRLAPEYRKMIVGGVMLVPSISSNFEVHVSDWLQTSSNGRYPTIPEVKKIQDMPLLCLYSEVEDGDLCPLLNKQSNVILTQLSGGHNFGKHYSLITKKILQAMAPAINPAMTNQVPTATK